MTRDLAIEVLIYPDADHLAAGAADRIIQAAHDAIAARGRFTLALSGGSTPEKTYALLARPDRAARLDWSRIYLFFGDERFVPHDDSRSNCHMATRSLIADAPIAADHFFPIPTDTASPEEAAARYTRTLADFFGVPADGPPPAFDLVLLGLGDDGHTASLFPGRPALLERKTWVTASPPGVLPPPVDRVTLTFAALNAARAVAFLVAGAGKATVVQAVLEGGAGVDRAPAAGVRPMNGSLTWMLDEAAAARLSEQNRRG
jgi:6-phosphogluconolactonase